MREALKVLLRGAAAMAILPRLAVYRTMAAVIGPDHALEGATQSLATVPGLRGEYLRRAFLLRTISACHPSATVCWGSVFSKVGAEIEANVYVGAGCHLGLVHLERDVLLASGVHVPSGAQTHGTDDPTRPIREQPGQLTMVRIGHGTWVGSGAIVMADVGANCVIAAGSVVVRPIPDDVVAAGVPARVIRARVAGEQPQP
jgi:acetyltransferase-like isoleucine patch superfamily enzyme